MGDTLSFLGEVRSKNKRVQDVLEHQMKQHFIDLDVEKWVNDESKNKVNARSNAEGECASREIFKSGKWKGSCTFSGTCEIPHIDLVFNEGEDKTVEGKGYYTSGSFTIKGYYNYTTLKLGVIQYVDPSTSIYEAKCNYGHPFQVKWLLQWNDKKKKFKGKAYRSDKDWLGDGSVQIRQATTYK